MAERDVSVDHVMIWRWVQRYAPELHQRCRSELRLTNRSWRVDETYLRIAGKWTYLYRAVDSSAVYLNRAEPPLYVRFRGRRSIPRTHWTACVAIEARLTINDAPVK